jgi:predicted RNase H-like nuclease (RuvC/YqgF family)
MSASEQTLSVFTTRVRQMILQYEEMKQEIARLNDAVNEKNSEIETLQKKLEQAHNDYNSLKMAKMIEITDGDMEGAKKRLAKLISDVNKCITLLSDEK